MTQAALDSIVDPVRLWCWYPCHVVTSGAPFVVTDARTHPLVHASLAVHALGVVAIAAGSRRLTARPQNLYNNMPHKGVSR